MACPRVEVLCRLAQQPTFVNLKTTPRFQIGARTVSATISIGRSTTQLLSGTAKMAKSYRRPQQLREFQSRPES